MKVLFLGFAMPPYYRDFLNRLNSVEGLSIENVGPAGKNKNIGAGVFQEFSNIDFNYLKLEEIEIPSRRVFNLADFELSPAYKTFDGLHSYLLSSRPDLIVVNVAYHPICYYDKLLTKLIDRLGAKIIFHSIPFGLLRFEESLERLPTSNRLKLESLPQIGKVIRVLGLDIFYSKLIRSRAIKRPVYDAQKIYCYPSAHAVYHEDGVCIYESYGVPTEKIRVVRNSPNTEGLIDAANRHDVQPTNLRLLHIGRLVAWKRVDLLIKALASLKKKDFPELDLVVIGYGPRKEELQDLTKKLNVQDSVHFLGGIYDPDELAKQAKLSSIYVMPGMGGLSINEAMCFNLPIICSRGDSTEKYLVREDMNGLFFAEGDLDDLTKKLSELLGNPVRRTSMGNKSRQIIENEINTEIHVNNYIKLFNELTGETVSSYKSPLNPRVEECPSIA